MRLKLFRASDMAGAMAQVRKELGVDALILNTRNVPGGVEITAATDADSETPSQPPPRPLPDRLGHLTWHGVPQEYRLALAHGDLEGAVSRMFKFGALPLTPRDRPVMLTGPPGAGKTLTTVRLATRLVMSGVSPMIITTDGKRAGATEQLAAFTRLLNLPLCVASSPESVVRALAQRRDGAPVLIDTAGTDAREPDQAEQLRQFATTAAAYSALVLPAGLDPAEAAELAVAHADAGATFLVVTRLDLAHRLGGVIAAAAAAQLILTEAGVGPGAADGLVGLSPALLAERLNASHQRTQGRPPLGRP
jgi:flagellar biosynthesis protein FlhF